MELIVKFELALEFSAAASWSSTEAGGRSVSQPRAALWAAALFLSLPMLIAAYRKADALGMVLAELGIREGAAGARTYALRRVLGKLIPLGALVILALLVTVLGAAILPPGEVLLVLLALAALVSAFLWRSFVQVHARLQAALKETIEKPAEATPH